MTRVEPPMLAPTDREPPLSVGVVHTDADLEALMRILGRAFNMRPRDAERYQQLIGRENFRVLREGDSVAGGLAIIRMGQFFGGCSVPTAGIAAVGIAPWMRGRGAARFLMTEALRELRDEGFAISTLYPATQRLYRAVGYEIAGSQYDITVPLDAIHVKDSGLSVRPATEEDEGAVEKLYRDHAVSRAGHLDRNAVMWRRVRTPRGKAADGFVVKNGSALEGYVYFLQTSARKKPYSLHISDMLATTPAAARRLLSFLAEHRSVGEHARWAGSPFGPIIAALPENTWSIKLHMHWMVRILDVKTALEQRGYHACTAGTLHLTIDDDSFDANAGSWTIEVRNRKATVTHGSKTHKGTSGGVGTSGGGGGIRLSARALAPLYTGFMSAHDLATLGWLHADDAEALDCATGLFAGPMPCMGDGF